MGRIQYFSLPPEKREYRETDYDDQLRGRTTTDGLKEMDSAAKIEELDLYPKPIPLVH